MASLTCELPADTNQARGLAQYGIDFLRTDPGDIDPAVYHRLELFYRDSVACAVSALAARTNAPTVLRGEALRYPAPGGATCYGSTAHVAPEKSILANCAAVREWDANGTLFGYNPAHGHTKGEFGHNDFYPVVVAAAEQQDLDGTMVLKGMLLIDEIRGRLAEVYSLQDKHIDHVVHGAVAVTVVYGALLGATVDQIESAIGQFVSHYIPWRAIRSGAQLSDSKGASAAISAEAAVLCVHRALHGFAGPQDIFRNPQAFWSLLENHPAGRSPFDLTLSTAGSDFAVQGMHFKVGLYEHQSAGALQGLIDILDQTPGLIADLASIEKIRITIYEPAYSIICDTAKWRPTTRQSADHSMPYILATTLRKAFEGPGRRWEDLLLMPDDYSSAALAHPLTRALMEKIDPLHRGPSYDSKYPEGIPTSISIIHKKLGILESGLIMFPLGHAKNTNPKLASILDLKFRTLAAQGVANVADLEKRCIDLGSKSAAQIRQLHNFTIMGVD